ncbi:MAG: hypothetical protein U0Q07_12740 [Acidimicrobiales bacterium]
MPQGARRPRAATRLAIAAAVLVIAAACSSASSPSATPATDAPASTSARATSPGATTPAAAPRPHDFESFRNDGPMTTTKALQAFALAFGPLPDVDPPRDPALAFPGGTQTAVVLDVIARFRDLTPAQQAAVRRYLLPEAPGSTGSPGTTARPAATSGDRPPIAELAGFGTAQQSAEHDPQIDALIRRAVGDIRSHTGTTLDPVIETDFTADPTVDGTAWAVAEAYLDYITHPDDPAPAGRDLAGTKCRIHVAGNAIAAGAGSPQAYSTIAHEVFHCFQYASFPGTGNDFLARPAWVVEGGAAWVGEELAGGSGIPIAQSWWRNYLSGATDGSYDMFHNDGYLAIGFWERVDTAGGDAWHTVLPAVQQADDASAFAFVTHDDQGVLASWAASTVRSDYAPDGAWQLTTSNQAPTGDHRQLTTVSIGAGEGELTAPPGAQLVRALVPADGADFVSVEVHTPATYAWADHGPGVTTASGGGSTRYCLLDDCTCPDGSQPFGGAFTAIGPDHVLEVALSGTSSEAGRVKHAAISKEDACRPCRDGGGGGSGASAPIDDTQPTVELVGSSIGSSVGSSVGTTSLRAATPRVELAAVMTCPVPDIVGTWHGDLGAIISAASASVRLPSSVQCSGVVTLTFAPDGTFGEQGDGTCTVRGHTIQAQWSAAGSYAADGSTLTFSNATCSGSLPACLTNGTLTYTVDPTTLRLTQAGPNGPVTKTYTR